MAPDLAVGPAARVACALLAAGLAAYACAVARHAWGGLRRRAPDRWSAVAATLALAALAWAVWAWGPQQLPAPLSPALAAALAVSAVAAPAFTGLGTQGHLDAIAARLPGWLRWRLPDMDLEDRRKAPHLLTGLFALDLAVLGHFIVAGLAALGPAAAPRGEGWWNVLALRDGPWHAAGQVTAVWCALLLVVALLPIELVRLRDPAGAYPFKRIIEPRLREREAGLFGAHLYISVGLALALLALGRDPAGWPTAAAAGMAVVAVTVFADAASALVGIRWGRRRWFHNPGKSYAGTLGGAAVALACCVPLVGWVPGAAAALLFVAVDAAAPRPVPVSDNLLNPIGMAALFALVPPAPLVALP